MRAVAWGVAHRTLAGPTTHVDVVRGSRFVATVAPLADPDEADGWIERARVAVPDAHHVVWARRFDTLQRWSDDGEPGGTAGRPVLEVLQKRDVDRVVATVARVFGGVKLGAGGLVRAYGGAVARALDAARVIEVPDVRSFEVSAPFADADALLRLLADLGVAHEAPSFAADGVRLRGEVVVDGVARLETRTATVTRGRARWRWDDAAQRK